MGDEFWKKSISRKYLKSLCKISLIVTILLYVFVEFEIQYYLRFKKEQKKAFDKVSIFV